MKIIGWNLGQRGDIVMNTVVARGFKQEYPDSHVTLGIYKAYADMADLFKYHPHIDDVHIYDSYEDWPNEKDAEFLKNSKFDKVFYGMPSHSSPYWYNECKSQTEEACKMNGVKPPDDLQCFLKKWFNDLDEYKDCICIAPFSDAPKKDLSEPKANLITKKLSNLGYKIVQLSAPTQPKLKNVLFSNNDYFTNVRIMLSSRALITINTGMSWVASAYSHKTVGLYGLENWGYHDLISSSIYEPINPNAVYIRENNINDISVDSIVQNLEFILNKNANSN